MVENMYNVTAFTAFLSTSTIFTIAFTAENVPFKQDPVFIQARLCLVRMIFFYITQTWKTYKNGHNNRILFKCTILARQDKSSQDNQPFRFYSKIFQDGHYVHLKPNYIWFSYLLLLQFHQMGWFQLAWHQH